MKGTTQTSYMTAIIENIIIFLIIFLSKSVNLFVDKCKHKDA